MIKCITFDLDDTLWAVDPVVHQANVTLMQWLQDNAPLFTDRYALDDLAALRKQALQLKPEISHSVTLIRRQVLELGLRQAGYSDAQIPPLVDAAFDVFLDARQQISFFEHAVSMLDALRDQGYRMGALSNGNADIHRTGLAGHFDFQFNADGVGTEKPHPLMFEKMLAHTGLAANQVIHIGDNPVADIQGAHNAGVWSIWVNLQGIEWSGGEPAHQQVQCLSQIPAAIQRIHQQAAQQVVL